MEMCTTGRMRQHLLKSRMPTVSSTHTGEISCAHLLATVIARDSQIHVVQGRISVAHGNNRDVHIGALGDGLVVSPRISDQQHAGLNEGVLDLIGEGTRGESAGHVLSTSVLGELQDGTLTVGTSTDGTDISRVLDGDDDTGSQDQLLPCHVQVQNVDTILPPGEAVTLHRLGNVLGSKVNLARKQLAHIILSRVEHWPS